jgi:O-antigen/teichoic acid export membrane protein
MFKIIYQQLKVNTRLKQVVGLFSVNLVGIPLGIVTSIIVTKYLGAKGFGDYKFITSIFALASIIFTFGFYQAGNRALVLNKDSKKAKEYYGAELVVTAALFGIMSICLLIYGILDSNLQEKQLSKFFLYAIPFSWIFLIQIYFENLFQADNRIRLLAKARLYPQVGFLVMASLNYIAFDISYFDRLTNIWLYYISSIMIVYALIIHQINVSFVNIKTRLLEIWAHNKSYGFDVYIGSLFAVGFAQLSAVFISYYGNDNSGVGFYSLALTLSMPLAFIPNTIATTHYKDFSKQKLIPKKLIIVTLALSLSALIVLWVIVPPFVDYFYGETFYSVVPLNYIISIGMVAHGIADFFNRYMGANGQGKILRNTSFVVGISILVANIALIPKWGEYGAAYTNIISGFVYLIIMSTSYYKYINNENHQRPG